MTCALIGRLTLAKCENHFRAGSLCVANHFLRQSTKCIKSVRIARFTEQRKASGFLAGTPLSFTARTVLLSNLFWIQSGSMLIILKRLLLSSLAALCSRMCSQRVLHTGNEFPLFLFQNKRPHLESQMATAINFRSTSLR